MTWQKDNLFWKPGNDFLVLMWPSYRCRDWLWRAEERKGLSWRWRWWCQSLRLALLPVQEDSLFLTIGPGVPTAMLHSKAADHQIYIPVWVLQAPDTGPSWVLQKAEVKMVVGGRGVLEKDAQGQGQGQGRCCLAITSKTISHCSIDLGSID